MDQLNQSPRSRDYVVKLGRKVAVKNGEATVFALVGFMDQKKKMPAGHPPVGGAESPAPPAPADAKPPAAMPKEFTFDLPAAWEVGPPKAMRKATFVA